MYSPTFRTTRNGVPILKKEEIDAIGEHFVQDFQPEVLKSPAPVDIDRFIECYLGMTPDYQYLSHNGVYLGMTVFNDTDKVPVYCPETNRAEYIHADAGTVIIDKRLLAENQQHRYRFTLGHEGGHGIFHKGVFAYNPNQLSLFDAPQLPMVQCRVEGSERKNPRCWTDHDRMEWQANRLSSAILMPETAVRIVAKRHAHKSNNTIRGINVVRDMVTTFDVSLEAATYRLKDLRIVEDSFSVCSAALDFIDIFPESNEALCFG